MTGTFALVPQVVRAVRVPVVAAGGIADTTGVTAAMALGAAGVFVGTAYLLCPEATTSAVHRAALKSDAARRRSAAYRTYQSVLWAACPRHREPDHAGGRTAQRGCPGISTGLHSHGTVARGSRKRGPGRFLSFVVGAECERLQGSSGRTLDARVGRRSVIDGTSAHCCH
jgi:hypothetical protein